VGAAIAKGDNAVSGSDAEDAPVLKFVDGGEATDLLWAGASGGGEPVDWAEGCVKFIGR